jgi:formylglycine-generating enzyme required for sulfatase activity
MRTIGNYPFGNMLYCYRISTYEITNRQYAVFLNAVAKSDPLDLYDECMGMDPCGGITRSGEDGDYRYAVRPNFADKPANYVRWSGAIRFVNWLHNGQPEGAQGPDTTEAGAYELYETELDSYFLTTRHINARWALPDHPEWKKAALYDRTRYGTGGYWVFATRSDEPPACSPADQTGNLLYPGPNVVNYMHVANWNGSTDGNVTTVGSAGPESASYYGTYDQNGNVGEWTEQLSRVADDMCGRVIWGGDWSTSDGGGGIPPLTIGFAPLAWYDDPNSMGGHLVRGPKTGFRVVQLCPPALPGDVTANGRVDSADLCTLLLHYGEEGNVSARSGDVDCDGDVDLSDLGTLLANYGRVLDEP